MPQEIYDKLYKEYSEDPEKFLDRAYSAFDENPKKFMNNLYCIERDLSHMNGKLREDIRDEFARRYRVLKFYVHKIGSRDKKYVEKMKKATFATMFEILGKNKEYFENIMKGCVSNQNIPFIPKDAKVPYAE